MKRAYIASITIKNVVVAETPEKARNLACRAYRGGWPLPHEFELVPLSYLPAGWNGDSLVYQDDPLSRMTVDQAANLPGGWAFEEKAGKVSMSEDKDIELRIGRAILMTPTGAHRNLLCDASLVIKTLRAEVAALRTLRDAANLNSKGLSNQFESILLRHAR